MASANKELTITEAAEALGVSRQAIHKAITRGTLKATVRDVAPYGRTIFIEKKDLQAWRKKLRPKSIF